MQFDLLSRQQPGGQQHRQEPHAFIIAHPLAVFSMMEKLCIPELGRTGWA